MKKKVQALPYMLLAVPMSLLVVFCFYPFVKTIVMTIPFRCATRHKTA